MKKEATELGELEEYMYETSHVCQSKKWLFIWIA